MVGEPLDESNLPSLEKPIIPVDYVGIKVRKNIKTKTMLLCKRKQTYFGCYKKKLTFLCKNIHYIMSEIKTNKAKMWLVLKSEYSMQCAIRNK